MSQSPASGQHIAQSAFRTQRKLVFGRLAVDDEFRTARISCRQQGSQAVFFLAYNKQQSKIARSDGQQLLCGTDHRGDNSFGIASTAPADEFVVFARWKKRRDSVHVRG